MSLSARLSLLILLGLACLAQGKLTPEETDTLKLQIFLDSKNFTPGYLDGRAGKFTMKAIELYNRKLGKESTDIGVVSAAQKEVATPLALATVPSFARQFVDASLPKDRVLQSKRQSMPYRSYAEFMAERFHTSVAFLKKINSNSSINNLGPRKALMVPNVDPFLIEKIRVGKTYRADPKIPNHLLIIDTSTSQLKVYRKDLPVTPAIDRPTPPLLDSLEDMIEFDLYLKQQSTLEQRDKLPVLTDKQLFASLKDSDLVATFPITTGKSGTIRRGYWKVKIAIEMPIWRFDKQLLETGVRSKESLIIPGGPNNPVGVMWNGLTRPGIGIHGTSSPETIGRSKSAGCIRLANWDVVRLPAYIRPGSKVWLK